MLAHPNKDNSPASDALRDALLSRDVSLPRNVSSPREPLSAENKSSNKNKKKDVVVIAGDSLVKSMVGAYMGKDDVDNYYVAGERNLF